MPSKLSNQLRPSLRSLHQLLKPLSNLLAAGHQLHFLRHQPHSLSLSVQLPMHTDMPSQHLCQQSLSHLQSLPGPLRYLHRSYCMPLLRLHNQSLSDRMPCHLPSRIYCRCSNLPSLSASLPDMLHFPTNLHFLLRICYPQRISHRHHLRNCCQLPHQHVRQPD